MDTELLDELQQLLGDAYEVERELGGGGMSRVFLAVERSLERRVVIKVLPPALTSGVSATRFQREILVTAGLQHPHILPVLVAGVGDGLIYYITPYIEGQSLRERLTLSGALPIREATTILGEVASALAQAHARGVVHRDVKPENILLSAGHAVLADFGIARALALHTGTERITDAGYGLGTPGYMAPEQRAGDPTVDCRADVFALGIVGYEMFAGRPPFPPTASPGARARAYLADPPPPLDAVRPEVPLAVARAIARALAGTPEQRFATAAEFRDAIASSSRGSSARAQRRRRRLRLTLAGCTLVGLGLSGALGQWWEHRLAARRDGGAGERKTLAVLPFKHLGRPEDAYFTDGVTEEITSRLASLSGLGVISRTSADQYRASAKSLRQIAEELGATYVLEGSVRWERAPGGIDRVRVTPQLIRVRDDNHLWAARYDAELSDMFAMQSRIAESVARELTVALASGERLHMDARPTDNLAAYDSYMRGEQLRTHEATSQVALTRGAKLLGEAGAADPRFALAFAKLALAEQELYDRFFDRTEARRVAARVAADSALALAPGLPEAHLALGHHFESGGELERAGREYALAEAGRPNDSEILGRTAAVLARQGRWMEAMARLRRAATLDPRSMNANLSAAEGAMFLRDYPAALGYVGRALAIDSGTIEPYVMKARLQVLGGDRAATRETAREILLRFGAERAAASDGFDGIVGVLDTTDLQTLARVSPSAFGGNRVLYLYWRVMLLEPWQPALARLHADSLVVYGAAMLSAAPDDFHLRCSLAWLHAIRGQRVEAVRGVREVLAIVPPDRDHVAWSEVAQMSARTYVRAGELDAAVDQLQQLLRTPSVVSVPMLRTDPIWAPLRGNPRFEQLLARGS